MAFYATRYFAGVRPVEGVGPLRADLDPDGTFSVLVDDEEQRSCHIAYPAATEFDLAAVAVFYGGWLPTTDIPIGRLELTLSPTSRIIGHVLFPVGDNDHVVPSGQQREIADALRETDVRHEIVVSPSGGSACTGAHAPPGRLLRAGGTCVSRGHV
ncbi:dienelactone hydrolase family protein [Microbispora triticiradicis]|uniref:dienelactone hydrolase family protein n=1 Tax=Microbispora triticiradicis TaxID=2200763 RepID=UPI001AD7D629|nr:dienelactone hydrolase family protein [Microbispora triticiradicis]